MNKLDESFWADLRKLQDELMRGQPRLEPPPGRLRWLKRIILQIVRPLAVPQIEFNRHLLARLDRIETALRLSSDRLDSLDEMPQRLDKAMERFTGSVRESLERHGRLASAASAPPAGEPVPAGTPAQPPSLREALERGFYLQNIHPGRFSVLDEIENWDVLMILDACRCDAFERVWRQMPAGALPGTLHKRVSVGSHTISWLKETFRGRDAEAGRIVYLATNPHVSAKYLAQIGVSARFAHIEHLWDTRWDPRERTVMPQAVVEEYLRLREQFPDKKFILHFLQPHTPYVGKTRVRMNQPAEMPTAVDENGQPRRVPTELALLEDCQVGLQECWQAYDDNIRLALDCIAGLMAKRPPRAVISADHGELFGEYGMYSHVQDMNIPELIEVPWFVCD